MIINGIPSNFNYEKKVFFTIMKLRKAKEQLENRINDDTLKFTWKYVLHVFLGKTTFLFR